MKPSRSSRQPIYFYFGKLGCHHTTTKCGQQLLLRLLAAHPTVPTKKPHPHSYPHIQMIQFHFYFFGLVVIWTAHFLSAGVGVETNSQWGPQQH